MRDSPGGQWWCAQISAETTGIDDRWPYQKPSLGFPTADQIARAVLSGDCYSEVSRLGVQVECWNDLVDVKGCASAPPLLWLLALGAGLARGLLRRRKDPCD